MKIEVHKSVKIEIICIIFISIVLSLNLMRWLEIRNYHQTILRVRSRREESLKNMEKVMDGIKTMDTFQTKIDHEHLLTLRDLQKSIKISDVSASYILHAYMEKALEATKKFNCITDFLPECQTRLSELQDEPKGPLYGIPISIKENINCKGHDSTCGLRKFINKPIDEDCVIVQVLKIQGAIPFVKTNVPQTLFSYECSNPIYGQTINPLNPKRTPGGSSGGEAALIAAGGSILGIGTDVGGSIRLPAAFCGICGFKPTANRLSKKGLSVNSTGQRTVESSVGPLARDVDSLAYCMKALLCEDMFELDPTVPPLPFNDMSPRVVAGIKATGGIGSVKELWKHHIAAMAYRDEYVNAWKRQNIEVLLCPSLGPAFNIGYAGELSVASSYMVIFNLLNFPAGVVPVTHVTEEDEKELMNYTGFLNDIWDKTFKKAVAGGVDLPLAVQCVALPWQDELCLCFMKEVERLVNLKKIT
ncbi:fatty-acid amide hydrolase 1-like isoform X4 [Narcine bancroftii]|uniref:fatty-acid amide hydrolase 1-like isoform X4 n=1 Tax=Narcine bancroftii TaxID=1343680 RepID=UPI0038313937